MAMGAKKLPAMPAKKSKGAGGGRCGGIPAHKARHSSTLPEKGLQNVTACLGEKKVNNQATNQNGKVKKASASLKSKTELSQPERKGARTRVSAAGGNTGGNEKAAYVRALSQAPTKMKRTVTPVDAKLQKGERQKDLPTKKGNGCPERGLGGGTMLSL